MAASKAKSSNKKVAKKDTSRDFRKIVLLIQIVLIVALLSVQLYVNVKGLTDGSLATINNYGLWVVILIGLLPDLRDSSK